MVEEMVDGMTFMQAVKARPGIAAIFALIIVLVVVAIPHFVAMSGASNAQNYDTFVIVKETKVGMPESESRYHVHSFSYNFRVQGPAPSNRIDKYWYGSSISTSTVAEAKSQLALLFIDNNRRYEVIEQFSLNEFAEFPIIEFGESDYMRIMGQDGRQWIVIATLAVRAGSLLDCATAATNRMNEVASTYAPDTAEPTDFSQLMAAANEHKLSESCHARFTDLSLRLRN